MKTTRKNCTLNGSAADASIPSTRPSRPARPARTPVPSGRGPSLLDSAAQLLGALSPKQRQARLEALAAEPAA